MTVFRKLAIAAAVCAAGVTAPTIEAAAKLRLSCSAGGAYVCCETDTTPNLATRVIGKRVSRVAMPFELCQKRPNSKVIAMHHCINACMKKGAGWTWKNNRCQRAAVRDKRDPRALECRKRGKGWVWKNNRCQRAAVRDKRRR